jgi:hypothetical protein
MERVYRLIRKAGWEEVGVELCDLIPGKQQLRDSCTCFQSCRKLGCAAGRVWLVAKVSYGSEQI